MNYSGLPGLTFSGWSVFAFRISLSVFLILSSLGLWSRCASADVRRYNVPSAPNVPYPYEEYERDVDYLCEASKPDLGRYSDATIDRYIDKFRNMDASILNNYHIFTLKELNAIRRRLIECQSAFTEEQHKRLLRAKSRREEDNSPDRRK